ncbi:MAG TPA: hypothetical protein VH682_27575 [Gemmataceae bacterium]|jgi:hypothetical protein
MDLVRLIESLSRPEAYPEPPAEVQVRQTHISVVFLAGRHAYKIKKPVALGFLDLSTLEARRLFCVEEVRLNRRLAPAVYQGVVPVTRSGDGLRFGGDGEALEWAVQMQRLPEEATLLNRLRRGDLDAARVERLAQRIAAFHAAAETSPRIAAFARFDAIADVYFRATGDEEGRELLPLYTAYRSTVRAKVGGIKCAEMEILESERMLTRGRVRAHWLLALGELRSRPLKV